MQGKKFQGSLIGKDRISMSILGTEKFEKFKEFWEGRTPNLDYVDSGPEGFKPHARGDLKSSRREAAGGCEGVWRGSQL